MNYDPRSMEMAVDAVKGGKSIKSSSLEFKVPASTLKKRVKGIAFNDQAHSHRQSLSTKDEKYLAQWVLSQSSIGPYLTYQTLITCAEGIFLRNGSEKKLGKGWITGFLKRNPLVKGLRRSSLEKPRVEGTISGNIKQYFEKLNVHPVNTVAPQNKWNMGEIGVENRSDEARKEEGLKQSYETKERISIMECVSADGKYISPVVVFKGDCLLRHWFDILKDDPDKVDWSFITSSNGCTNNEILLEWLKKVFVPRTRPPNGETRLLIMDGCQGHPCPDFWGICAEENIMVSIIPPKSSHILQPLDLSIFSVLIQEYQSEIHRVSSLSETSLKGRKRVFMECYDVARKAVLKEEMIINGWKKSGLDIMSPEVPLTSAHALQAMENEENSESNDKIIITEPYGLDSSESDTSDFSDDDTPLGRVRKEIIGRAKEALQAVVSNPSEMPRIEREYIEFLQKFSAKP